METLLQDLRFALRSLRRRPVFTLLAILALALGIGANTAIFSIVNTVLLRPLPVAEPGEVAMLFEHKRATGEDTMVSPANYHAWEEENESFEYLSPVGYWYYTVSGVGDPENVLGVRVDSDFFDIITRQPVLGRRLLAEDDRLDAPPVTVISHRMWQSRFGGDRGAIGQTLRLNGDPYTVVGVMPPGFQYPSSAVVWVPAAFDAEEQAIRWRYLFAIGRLRDDVSLRQAQTELTGIAQRLEQEYPEANSGWGVTVQVLHEVLVEDARSGLLMLLGAVALVLLIACANVASLLLARSASRRREMAVRSALGAGRRRTLRQLFTESILLALLGGLVGLALAAVADDLLLRLLGDAIPRRSEMALDGTVLLVTLGISLLTGVLFGLAPVLQVSRVDLITSLKEGKGKSAAAGGRRGLQALIVCEVALAVIVLISAGLLIRSFFNLRSIDPGFEAAGVLAVPVSLPGQAPYDEDAGVEAFYAEVAERLGALPGVEEVGGIDAPPLRWPAKVSAFSLADRPAPPQGEEPKANVRIVFGDYFEAMQVPLLRGRRFAAADTTGSPPVVLVNRQLAETFWPQADPVGRRLTIDDVERQVVGVVADTQERDLVAEVTPSIYLPFQQAPEGGLTLMLRTRVDPATLVEPVRKAIWQRDPELPLEEVAPFAERMREAVAEPRSRAMLLGIFALLALLLASLGIYGIVAYSVNQRTDEIGLRMALGAAPRDVMRLILGQGLWTTVAGIVIGLVGALLLGRLLETLLFGVSAVDPAIFAGIALVLAVVALAASWIPAHRAARVDPVVALRHE